jgi:putative acetyltransferase
MGRFCYRRAEFCWADNTFLNWIAARYNLLFKLEHEDEGSSGDSEGSRMEMRVRRARVEDHEELVELWERSVRASHHFLTEGDIVGLRPFVREGLAKDSGQLWVLLAPNQAVMGFLGYADDTVEALFIDPAYHRQGGGKFLIGYAQSMSTTGALAVDVNEQNEEALHFYEAQGFVVVARSPLDSEGRPFPILHMKRGAPPRAH